jgi:hypothetical protein
VSRSTPCPFPRASSDSPQTFHLLRGSRQIILHCAEPFVCSSPFQCPTKQGREELLTAAVEQDHSDSSTSHIGSRQIILPCAHRARLQMIPPSSLIILQGWGLINLPLRPAFSPAHPPARRDVPLARAIAFRFPIPPFRGVAEAALYCAHRTSTVSPCAFCEQEGHLATPSPPHLQFSRPTRRLLSSRSSLA